MTNEIGLSGLTFNTEYRSGKNSVVNDFFIPALSHSILYQRAVGFFSSSSLIQISAGIMQLIKNGGKVQLIVSPHLSEEDIKSIELGYKKREEVFVEALNREMHEPKNDYELSRLNILANLIAENKLDIKIASLRSGKMYGIYHEKMGLISDDEGNAIAFSGSTNETETAFRINYEVLDIYCSWKTDFEFNKVTQKKDAFDLLWKGLDPIVITEDFPKVAKDKLLSYKKHPIMIDDYIDPSIPDDEPIATTDMHEKTFFKVPSSIKGFYDYQETAANRWIAKNAKGIFNMATGSGKTYTALLSLCKLSEKLNDRLAVFIVAPLQHLVEQWVEDIEMFGVNPIVAYSDPSKKNWKELLSDSVNAFKYGAKKNFCVVTTIGTFETEYFQKELKKIKKNACIVVDEAHNFGANKVSELMPENCEYRLALSATIDRFRDESGTQKIYDYFGEVCQEFTLEEAIRRGFLTSYYYYPVLVYLNDEELIEYQELSKKVAKLGGGTKENCENNKYLESLLLRRARIIAGANNKIDALLTCMEPFKNDNHMLVYCGATNYKSFDDMEDVKQIDIITSKLNEKYSMKVRKFTSSESKIDRQIIKKDFIEGKDLQIIAAIKCLDEGLNIPSIKRAFILASSTNPKEYIQRRGRVLRKYDGKEYSEIYDFITLPRPLNDVCFVSPEEIKLEISMVYKELDRMMDFAKSSRKPSVIDKLKEEILEAYGIYISSIGGNVYDN